MSTAAGRSRTTADEQLLHNCNDNVELDLSELRKIKSCDEGLPAAISPTSHDSYNNNNDSNNNNNKYGKNDNAGISTRTSGNNNNNNNKGSHKTKTKTKTRSLGDTQELTEDLEALSELLPGLKTGDTSTTANTHNANNHTRMTTLTAPQTNSPPNHNHNQGRNAREVEEEEEVEDQRRLRLLDSMVAVKGNKSGIHFHEDETLHKMTMERSGTGSNRDGDSDYNDDTTSEEEEEGKGRAGGKDAVGRIVEAEGDEVEVDDDDDDGDDDGTSSSGSTIARTHSSAGNIDLQQVDEINDNVDENEDDDNASQTGHAHTTAAFKSPYKDMIDNTAYDAPSPYQQGNNNNTMSSDRPDFQATAASASHTTPATKRYSNNNNNNNNNNIPNTPETPQTDTSPNSIKRGFDFHPQSSVASFSNETHTAASMMSHEVRMPISLPNFRPATGCTNASDYVVRCFVARLRAGITVVKHGRSRWCKSRLRVLHVHSDGRSLSWKPAQGEPASSKRAPRFDLSTCVEVRHAWTPDPLNPMFTGTPILRQKCESANAFKSFALIFPKRTVDITAVTADQCKVLMEGFSALCFRLQVALGGASGNGNEDGNGGGGTGVGDGDGVHDGELDHGGGGGSDGDGGSGKSKEKD